jgi:hypothetical protein
MIAESIVNILLEEAEVLPPQMEASVHLPFCSRVWVESFTGPEQRKLVFRHLFWWDRSIFIVTLWPSVRLQTRLDWFAYD